MKFEDVAGHLNDCFSCEKLENNVIKINTQATFIDGKEISLLIENKNNKWFLTDGKATLKYINELYDLKSKDVKMCISNVLKIYGFSISSGVLVVEIPSEKNLTDKIFDMIMCIGQLANMYAFFDKP